LIDGRPPLKLICNAVDELSLQRFMELSEVPGVQNDLMDNPNALSIQPILALSLEDGLAAGMSCAHLSST
jgi:hypothetical protein